MHGTYELWCFSQAERELSACPPPCLRNGLGRLNYWAVVNSLQLHPAALPLSPYHGSPRALVGTLSDCHVASEGLWE